MRGYVNLDHAFIDAQAAIAAGFDPEDDCTHVTLPDDLPPLLWSVVVDWQHSIMTEDGRAALAFAREHIRYRIEPLIVGMRYERVAGAYVAIGGKPGKPSADLFLTEDGYLN